MIKTQGDVKYILKLHLGKLATISFRLTCNSYKKMCLVSTYTHTHIMIGSLAPAL